MGRRTSKKFEFANGIGALLALCILWSIPGLGDEKRQTATTNVSATVSQPNKIKANSAEIGANLTSLGNSPIRAQTGLWRIGGFPLYARLNGGLWSNAHGIEASAGWVFDEGAVTKYLGLAGGKGYFRGQLRGAVYDDDGKHESWYVGPQFGVIVAKLFVISSGVAYQQVTETGRESRLNTPTMFQRRDFQWVPYLNAGVSFFF